MNKQHFQNFMFAAVLFFVSTPLWLNAQDVEQNHYAGKKYAVVTIAVASMRDEPDYGAEMATQCLLGMPMQVLEKKNGWYRVLTPEKYDCWVNGGSIKLMTREELNQWIESPKIICLADSGYVLEQPLPDSNDWEIISRTAVSPPTSSRISDIVSGCVLQYDKKYEGNFYSVRFPDGRSGYVYKSFKMYRDFDDWKNNTTPTGDSLTYKAKDLMGTSYLWGGTSSKMLDCSGMTKLCFFLNGVIIPRNASQQAKVGEDVNIANGYADLQKGDLLFFGTAASSNRKERITHVGMSLGGGDFIHEAGRVHISSLNPESKLYDESSAKRFVKAKRLITKIGETEIIPIRNHPLYCIMKNSVE